MSDAPNILYEGGTPSSPHPCYAGHEFTVAATAKPAAGGIDLFVLCSKCGELRKMSAH